MMGRLSEKQGFTIIETMLVLAISGLMMVGIIASVSSSLSAQRYKDAANAAVSYFQGQYNLAANTRNDRDDQSYCGIGRMNSTATAQSRGTTDCTIVGRILRIEGDTITSSPLYATVDADTVSPPDLNALGLAEDERLSDKYTLEWGASLYRKGGTPSGTKNFTVMILRSPFTGSINTFVDTTSSTTGITGLLSDAGSLTTPAEFCVEAGGGMMGVASSRLGIKIESNSPNASGVALVGEGSGC